MNCRHCQSHLEYVFLDLGSAPPSNAYLSKADLAEPEIYFPLKLQVCTRCWLVQTEDYAGERELFSPGYAYFSSYSTSWLMHAENYVLAMIERFKLGSRSLVAEIASNDGYLLQYVKKSGIPCFGVEPTLSTAASAREKGLDIVEDFFGIRLATKLAEQRMQADLIVANNVLAHVPDINDFVAGFTTLLKPTGVATFEFPHLMRLIADNQFDTIYHEHFSYLSFTAVLRIFDCNGLTVFDVEELPTHGGSLRVFAQRTDTGSYQMSSRVNELLDRESATGMKTREYYSGFQQKADTVKYDFISFLIEANREGKRVTAYGAAAKGNTLLNYAGIRPDLITCVVDRNPAKQGKYLPGSRIPIVDESFIMSENPDYVVVLPWNIRSEIMTQLAYIRQWGGQFVTAVPSLIIA
jgi:SAM-dependent methyltransferase